MSKPFNIHDWQAKQKRLTEAEDDRPHNWKELPGYNPDAFYPRKDYGAGNPKLEEWKQIDDMFEEVNRAAQGWLEKWINEDHIAKALEDYNQGWNNFEDNTLSALNFISTASPAEDMIGSGGKVAEMSTTGTGASFNAGSGEGYMTPNAFKKKNKKD